MIKQGPITPNMLERPKTKADALRIIENLRMYIYQANPCSVTVEGESDTTPAMLGFGAAAPPVDRCIVTVRTCEKTFIFKSDGCCVQAND